MNHSHYAVLLPVLALAFSSFGCGAAASDPTTDDGLSQADADAVVKMCGGIAGLTCPKGYDCTYDHHYPDAAGKCVKDVCVQPEMCALTAHFDHDACACVPNSCTSKKTCAAGQHWDSTLCACVKSPTCLTLTC